MKILCVVTNSHKILFDEYFIKTIHCPENVIVKNLNLNGDGRYRSKDWQKAVNAKTEFVISYLNSVDDGTFFVFSDVDIQFFHSFDINILKHELIESKKDILFQRESFKPSNTNINSGFYIAKSSPNLLDFFNQVLRALDESNIKSDQTCINNLLPNAGIKWGYLTPKYYARSHGFPPPISICCHHANTAWKIDLKIRQLEFVRNYIESGFVRRKLIFLGFKVKKMKKSLIEKIKKAK